MVTCEWRTLGAALLGGLIVMIGVAGCQSQPDETFECTDALGCVDIAPGDPVKIGVLQDRSGGAAPVGEGTINSIQLAASERGNEILGHAIELQIEDEHCTKEGGANAALRIVADTQMVGILGTTCSDAAITASPIMSEAGLVMVSGANTAPSLTGFGNIAGEDWQPGYFRTTQSGLDWGKAMATFAVQELGLTRAATINDGDVFAVQHARIFEDTFKALGGEIVLSAQVGRGDLEMEPVLRAISETGVEFVFAPIFLTEAEHLILTAHDMDLMDRITFSLAGSVVVDEWVETVGLAGVGVYFVVTATTDGTATDTFRAHYEQTYGTVPEHPMHLFGYDAALLLFNAIETTAVQDKDHTLHIGRQALRDTLYATHNLDGITGPLTCNTFGDCGVGQSHIVRFDDPAAGIDGLLKNVVFVYTPAS